MALTDSRTATTTTPFHNELSLLLGSETKVLSELKKVFVRPLIQIAMKAVCREHIEEGILDRISQKYNIPEERLDEYYSVILAVVRTHFAQLTQDVKPPDFRQTLEDLKMSTDCIEELSTVLYGPKRREIINSVSQGTRFYSHLVSCRWRVDITISSSVLNRVLEPTIIMQWIFDNGECQTFELSLSKFHQLRQSIAYILGAMESIEGTLT